MPYKPKYCGDFNYWIVRCDGKPEQYNIFFWSTRKSKRIKKKMIRKSVVESRYLDDDSFMYPSATNTVYCVILLYACPNRNIKHE